MSRKGTPVTINGVTYPSRVAAGKALGFRPNLISLAVHRGRLDRLGVGPGNSSNRLRDKPVTIRGVTYPSFKVAAAALGMHKSTISCAYIRDTLDRVGITKGLINE